MFVQEKESAKRLILRGRRDHLLRREVRQKGRNSFWPQRYWMAKLVKLREALGVYYVRNQSQFPNVVAGAGTWGELISTGGDYLKFPPKNNWIGGAAATVIKIQANATPDVGWQTAYGWIYDPTNGNLWAGSFDANDQPYPKP